MRYPTDAADAQVLAIANAVDPGHALRARRRQKTAEQARRARRG